MSPPPNVWYIVDVLQVVDEPSLHLALSFWPELLTVCPVLLMRATASEFLIHRNYDIMNAFFKY